MALEIVTNAKDARKPRDRRDEAYICSYECTFCPECTAEMRSICPNCGGELVRPCRGHRAGAVIAV